MKRFLALNSALKRTSLKNIVTHINICENGTVGTRRCYGVMTSSSSGESFLKSSPIATRTSITYASRFYSERIIKTPSMADSITEGELARWEKKVGDSVKEHDVVAVIETDKVDIEVPSPISGTISAHLAKPGDTVKVGQDLFKVDDSGKPSKDVKVESKPESVKTSVPPSSPTASQSTVEKSGPVKDSSSPKSSTPSTGLQSQTIKENVMDQVKSAASSSAATSPAVTMTKIGVDGAGERRVKMSRMRLRIAERLKEAQNTAASLTTFNEIDMTNLMQLRAQYKEDFAKKHSGLKLGFMSAFVKASAVALQEIPEVNARIEGTDMVYNDYVDISVAVATPKGLVTPVLRNVENMTYRDIEKTISDFGEKARNNQITVDDMAGGTFTISNGGVFGSLVGTPILNPPQSAILGMHAIKERPIALNGQVVIRPMMYVALTYDHRMVDGREAVTFLVRIKELVEDPRRLLLDL